MVPLIVLLQIAPHAKEEKAQPMTKAPFGIVGSETAFPLLYTHFVKMETGHYNNLLIT